MLNLTAAYPNKEENSIGLKDYIYLSDIWYAVDKEEKRHKSQHGVIFDTEANLHLGGPRKR